MVVENHDPCYLMSTVPVKEKFVRSGFDGPFHWQERPQDL
jgi:hypothetical protein